MRAISLFSGIGGFDLGFQRAGIETVLQAEQDPHCLKVLERHWPNVRRVTDVRAVGNRHGGNHVEGEQEPTGTHRPDTEPEWAGIDLVYGGFPCQPFSVAGKRLGDADERDGWPWFRDVVSTLRPRWVVAENVPGLLSFAGGSYFARILSDLCELGYGVAWGIRDAQFFGVAQRRRRVFIVATREPDGRAGAVRGAQVLSVCESCGGNPETRRAPGKGVAYSLTAGVRGTGDGHGNAWNSNYVTAPTLIGGAEGRGFRGDDGSNAYAIRTANTGANGHGVADDVAHTIDGASGQAVAAPLTASAGHHGRGDGSDNLVASTLIGGSEGRGFRGDDGSATYVAAPLGSNATGGTRLDLDHDTYVPDVAPTLTAQLLPHGVRRLTPLECERLQGFPDGWTRYVGMVEEMEHSKPWHEQADSHRYRQLGNAVAVPCAEWIGHRIVALNRGDA